MPTLGICYGMQLMTNMLGGQIVRVLGPGGYWHYYAHLSEFGDIKEGQLVTAGTVLTKKPATPAEARMLVPNCRTDSKTISIDARANTAMTAVAIFLSTVTWV